MRIFIGIPLSDKLKEFIIRIQRELEDNCKKGRFTKIENIHITLNFIGELSENKVQEIEKIINKIVGELNEFYIVVKGIGVFENNNKRLYFAKVQNNEQLISLQMQLSNELSKIGLYPERRAYKPHLTLGRNVELVSGYDTEYMEENYFQEELKEVTIFESVFLKNGVEYTEIFTQRLR